MRRVIWPLIAGAVALWLVFAGGERPVSTGEAPLPLPVERPVALAALPGGGWAIGGQGGGITVLDAAGAERARWVGHGGAVRRIVLRGGELLTAGDGSVAAWALDGRGLWRQRLAEHTLNDLAATDAARVVAADRGSVARLDPAARWHARGTHGRATFAVAASTDGARFASGGADGMVAVWDPTGAERTRWRITEGWVTALAWTDAGLLVGDSDGRLSCWRPADGPPPTKPTWQTLLAPSAIVGLAADGSRAIVGTEAGAGFVVELAGGEAKPLRFELEPGVEPAALSAVAIGDRPYFVAADLVVRAVGPNGAVSRAAP